MFKRTLALFTALLLLVTVALPVSADSGYNDTTIDWSEHPVHIYDDCKDLSCNVCGAVRKPGHVYDNDCDVDCNYCEFVRTTMGHQFDHDCDAVCNLCGDVRPIQHLYIDCFDETCNLCGDIREAPGHVYDDSWDATCNVCDEIRGVVSIVTQPQSVCVAEGATASVTIAVTGDGLTYTWYYAKKGATKFYVTTTFTGDTYSVAMSADRNGRQIYCVITDKYGNSVQTQTVTINMLPHSYTDKVTKQPTCTATGVKIYTCSACSHSYTESIAALGHTWKDVTCTTPKTCATCGATEGTALGHSYTGKVTKQPTCTATGVKTYTCSSCSHSYTESIAALGHVYDNACDTNCNACGEKNPNIIHDIEYVEALEATCSQPGNIACWICEPCGGIWLDEALTQPVRIEDVITYKDHTYEYECAWYCMECGERNPNGDQHNLVHVEAKDPTCQEAGNYAYSYCTYCNRHWMDDAEISPGMQLIRPLPMYHKLTHVPAVEATCQIPGNIEYWYCNDCGIYLYGEEQESFDYEDMVTYKNHTYTSAVTKQPTCTATGVKTYTCSACSHSYTESIAPLGHTWKDATCTAPKTCDSCGATSGTALGHSYTSKVTKEPTCTATGVKTYTCSSCSHNYTENIAALGHTWTTATCTTPKTCATCGATEGSALGHSYKSVVTAPDCINDGYTTYICIVCDDHYIDETIAALGHAYDNGCDTTCNACGESRQVNGHTWAEGACSVCGVASPSKVTIKTEPKTGYAQMGSKVTVKVTAEGEGLTYTWHIKNAGSSKYSKSSVTKSSYSVTMSDKVKDRLVFCRVYDKYGNMVQSKTVRLRESVSITKEPTSAAYAQNGKKVSVKITAAGDGLKYTWYIKNDGATKYSKSSVTSATYSATMGSKVKGRRVYCIVTDAYNKTVQSKTFILRESVSIVTEPKTVTVKKNTTAKVTVKASGDGLKYTWYIKNEGQTKYSKSSVTSATYSTTMNTKSKNRLVYCVVTDKYGNTVKTVTVRLKMK